MALLPAVAGVCLLGIMFLPWFGAGGELERSFEEARQIQQQFGGPAVPIPDVEENAWEAFTVADVMLLAAALGGVAVTVTTLAARPLRSRLAVSFAATWLGIVAAAVVAYRVANPVGDASRELGLFCGLIAAAGVAVGSRLVLREAEAARLRQRCARRDRARHARPSRSRSSSD